MLIKNLDVFPIEFKEAVDNFSTRYIVIVRVEAQDGTVGWGDCFSLFREATASISALIEQLKKYPATKDLLAAVSKLQ